MAADKWTAEQLPNLAGKTIVVTGGNSGIGCEAASQFARKGAKAVLACRSLDKGRRAADEINRQNPYADVEVMELDLSNLRSIRDFADTFHRQHRQLDVLCNNAGVMALPKMKTADGFEMQFGTNHLGHFALTGLLLDTLMATPGARIVTVSSGAHRMGQIRFNDLNWESDYGKWRAYGQSKLANLLFAFELQRKLAAAKSDASSLACHPGYAATNLQAAGPRLSGSSLMESVMGMMNNLFAQNAAMGAMPTLYAAAAPQARGGDYIGPDGFGEMWGYPTKVGCSAAARDTAAASRLWELSEKLTGVSYRFSTAKAVAQ